MSRPSDVYLLDTNILVHLVRRRGQADRLEALYGLTRGSAAVLISVVTIGEILSLATQWRWGEITLQRMHKTIADLYSVDISIPGILERYADIDSACVVGGRKMGKNDLWLAATASYLNVPLLTTDADFDHLGGWLRVVRVDPESLK